MATIALPVFLKTEMKTGQIENSANFWGALFFNLINVMFNGMQELAMILNHRVCTPLLQALWRAQVVAKTLGTFTLPMAFVLGGFVVAKVTEGHENTIGKTLLLDRLIYNRVMPSKIKRTSSSKMSGNGMLSFGSGKYCPSCVVTMVLERATILRIPRTFCTCTSIRLD
ncbi:hypothetical protein Fot_08142 [Forsythia ovata]|uniref:Uncharacterized protein n=1 Tax=Forsythia ovata TaxID=205694 RepID=A0ABD1X0S4_9LAMI